MRTIDISVRDRQGRPIPGAAIQFKLNGKPAGSVPNSEGHGRIEGVDRSDVVEVAATYEHETKTVKLGPNQDNYAFNFEVDLNPPALQPVRLDLIDAAIILFIAAALDIFLFAMATQFINSPVF